MSSNLVVVAIPAADDRVRKVSSEKVPHLTICFLGDAPSNPHVLEIMQFVEHAIEVSEHGPFMLRKDYRDVLGDDKADVIHFERDYSFKWINQFRSQLLQNESIRKAYDSVEQYPEWMPHLTLGYPETPAKELEDGHEYDLDWVTFDRIGVWTGNYEGPSWRLKWPEREELDTVGWSGVPEVAEKPSIEEALEHFGVKGMHWGVRTTNRQFAKSGKLASRAEKLDEKAGSKSGPMKHFLEGRARSARLNSIRLDQEVHRKVMYKASASARKDMKALRKKPEFQNINYRDERNQPQFNVDKFRKLEKEEARIWTSHLNKVVKDRGYEFDAKTSGNTWELVPKQVKHADDEALEAFVVNVIRDDDGFFVDAELADTEKEENSLAQTALAGEEYLEHFGVKGMKWGIRKAVESVKSGAKAVGRGLSALGAALGDSQWQSSTYSDVKHEAVHNHVAKELDNRVARLQTSPKYRGKNLKADSNLRKEYYQDVAKVTDSAYRRGVKETYGENFTGTKSAHYVNDVRGPRIEVRNKQTKEVDSESPLSSMKEIKRRRAESAAALSHAQEGPDLSIQLYLDDNGQIKGVGFVKPTGMAQADNDPTYLVSVGEEWLEHFGIKGMRWGVRKERELTTQTHIDTGLLRRRTKVRVEGGHSKDAHPDAVKAAIQKQTLKKSGPAALSTQELRDLANRLQVENQVAVLTSSKGKRFVNQQLEEETKGVLRRGTQKGVRKAGPVVVKRAGKAAATGAVALAL